MESSKSRNGQATSATSTRPFSVGIFEAGKERKRKTPKFCAVFPGPEYSRLFHRSPRRRSTHGRMNDIRLSAGSYQCFRAELDEGFPRFIASHKSDRCEGRSPARRCVHRAIGRVGNARKGTCPRRTCRLRRVAGGSSDGRLHEPAARPHPS